MIIPDACAYLLPVVGVKQSPTGPPAVTEVYGTAFSIGQQFWLTAGHVARSAAANDYAALGVPSGTRLDLRPLVSHEVHNPLDLALLESPRIDMAPLSWSVSPQVMLAPVLSVGFPYALNRSEQLISIRGFRGHIVSAEVFPFLAGRPLAYELSFQCPRGLSGAPLIIESTTLHVVGLIIGNAATQMLVFTDREVLAEGQTTIVERYESLQFGIALQAQPILNTRFDRLGRTVEEHLSECGLLRS